jgi:hypothetical protein
VKVDRTVLKPEVAIIGEFLAVHSTQIYESLAAFGLAPQVIGSHRPIPSASIVIVERLATPRTPLFPSVPIYLRSRSLWWRTHRCAC